MADTTTIEWSDTTLNLWFGCTQLSPACDHCYAMRWGPRLKVKWNGPPRQAAQSAYDKIAAYQRGAQRWLKKHGRPRRIFINSLSDFFDNQAEDSWRHRACNEMQLAPDVIFILVTKRPQNVAQMVPSHWMKRDGWPKNVWLLTTAENQTEWDRRVAWLLTIPAAVLGVSIEPMLGKIGPHHALSHSAVERAAWSNKHRRGKTPITPEKVGTLRWAIIGGESGKKARPMPSPFDVITLVGQLRASRVAVFIKQMSEFDQPDTFKDPATFPKGLRQREHP